MTIFFYRKTQRLSFKIEKLLKYNFSKVLMHKMFLQTSYLNLQEVIIDYE